MNSWMDFGVVFSNGAHGGQYLSFVGCEEMGHFQGPNGRKGQFGPRRSWVQLLAWPKKFSISFLIFNIKGVDFLFCRLRLNTTIFKGLNGRKGPLGVQRAPKVVSSTPGVAEKIFLKFFQLKGNGLLVHHSRIVLRFSDF